MKKIFKAEKWKRRSLTALSVACAATLSLGMFAACAGTKQNEENEKTPVAPTDTQLLKNGNFEFYSDNNQTELAKKVNIVSSPNSWSFTSGSPSSDAASGIINTNEWNYYARTGGYSFSTFTKGEGEDAQEITTFRTIEEAAANWDNENVSAFDRIKFLYYFKDDIKELADGTEAKTTLNKYNYSVDYDDVKKLNEDLPQGVSLRSNVASGETSVLMIHNDRTSDGVRGTAQYYTSSTTINLQAGTSAQVSLWVRTDKLYHYQDTELAARGGAYIGVINTVGGSTLDQMQIYNINTEGEWVNYTVYVRASTFASSSFRIVLGLGQGSSDDRYYSVDGYAFFDDVTCKIISDGEFESAVLQEGSVLPKPDVRLCTVDSLKEEKRFATDDPDNSPVRTFALDLDARIESNGDLLAQEPEIGLTEEKSGSKTYTSKDVDSALAENENDFTKVATLGELANSENHYVKNVYENDFKDKFPFGGEDTKVLMLLSSNGAAYTAKVRSSLFTLKKNTRLLLSFYVKTNKVSSGLTGAGATVVDGETKTAITSVDTTVLAGVDIDAKGDDSQKDIFKGWTPCFFFLENDTEEDVTFYLEFSIGPTTIIGTNRFSYGDGYAAFTNFGTKQLTKTEYGYATTGDRAKKVSLTGGVEETKKFDSVSVTDEKTLENAPALPANFRGVLGGSDFVQNNEESKPNQKPSDVGVTAGLINSKYADNYLRDQSDWAKLLGASGDAKTWWRSTFGNARQPLLIINNEENVSYGFFSESASVSASSYQRISLRVKASADAIAYVYLTETDASKIGKSVTPDIPQVTYWYDDDGNIYRKKDVSSEDPTENNFDELMTMAYELQENGLYKRVGDDLSGTRYANLHNYEKDEEGNLIAKSGEIVYYLGEDGTFYAYHDEESGEFTVPVTNLPTDIARYDYTDRDGIPSAKIRIVGTGDWVNVNFYIHAESDAKNYRLEVWNGSRDGSETNPANSYVIFDNYISESASSDYTNTLNESVQGLKDQLNAGKDVSEDGYLGDEDNLPKEYANYYTFTFYDSLAYVRYDETADEDQKGNPWASYDQFAQTEKLVTLYYVDNTEGNTKSYNFFFDYAAIDVSVTPDETADADDDTDTNSDSTNTPAGETNIWLLISSGILAVVLLAVILIIIVRRLWSKRSKKAHIKPAKEKRSGKKQK